MQVSEGRIIAALRDEVTAAEVRLEEERAAHTNTQRASAAREQVYIPRLVFRPRILYCYHPCMKARGTGSSLQHPVSLSSLRAGIHPSP